jgi:hypothetical protein
LAWRKRGSTNFWHWYKSIKLSAAAGSSSIGFSRSVFGFGGIEKADKLKLILRVSSPPRPDSVRFL